MDKIGNEKHLCLNVKNKPLFFQFKKLVNRVKKLFPLNLKNKKETQKKISKEYLKQDGGLNNPFDTTSSLLKSNLEEKSFENLKNYINKLYKMQNEKE